MTTTTNESESEWFSVDEYPELTFTRTGTVVCEDNEGHRRVLEPVWITTNERYFARYIIDATPPRRSVTLAELYLLAFVGPPPHPDAKPHALDGNRANLSIENLAWQ